MKKSIFLLAFAVFAAGLAAAQSAERVSTILEERQVSYGEIAYLAASELGLVQENASYEDSLDAAVQAGIVKGSHDSADPVSYSALAFMCSKTWNINRSLLFRLSDSPHYAFKQLQALGIIPTNADPAQKVSGHTALNIITACIDKFAPEGDE